MHWTTCPFCGKGIETADGTEGQMIDCPACNEAVRVCPGILRWPTTDEQRRSGRDRPEGSNPVIGRPEKGEESQTE